jgi:hypothetical protein
MKNAGKKVNSGKGKGTDYKKMMANIVGKEGGTYKCHICNKETNSSVDAMTHLIDHVSSALEAINTLIKDQKTGKVSEGKKTGK